MAKKKKKGVSKFSFQSYNLKHFRTTEQYVAAVNSLFDRATKAIANAAVKGEYDPDKPFSFDDYPDVKVYAQKIITGLANNVTSVVETGVKKEWLAACKKNDEFIASIMDTSKLSKKRLEQLQDRNLDALQTFQQRKIKGLDLSKRVWKYTEQYKAQIELGLDVGLGEGRSAQQLSRDLKQNLNNPDKLFRRVRDKHGNLVLSKAAKAFHPGQGVYRSAHKNAMRLARSEINMAYRESDYLRWQQLDFVVGFEVHRSNHEPLCKCDLCQRLTGRYPKTFKFVGWHPQCMCYATAILMDEKTFDEQELSDLKSALYGKEYKKLVPKNAVTDLPQGFKDWVAENMQKQANWTSTPYFIRDNFVNANLADGLKYGAPAKPIKPVKTEQQKADIQARWNTRVTNRKYNDQLQEIKAKYGKESNTISDLTDKISKEIQRGADISKIDSMMDELKHKSEVKAAWDERVEINRLETLLVDVKNLKKQFDIQAIESVFNAVEKKLATWENLPLEQQANKLNFEIDWVEKNKKYDTWKVAQDAYKKRLEKVEYLIGKQVVKASITHAIDFAKSTKSEKVKQMAEELSVLLDKETPVAVLQEKAHEINLKVAELEAAKAARQAKKYAGSVKFDESNYSQERKNNAMWEKKSPENADKKIRDVCSKVWQNATKDEKEGAYYYTHTYSSINEPLRGITYYGDKSVQESQSKVPHITSIINKSSYDFDIWVQRGVDHNGFTGLFGMDLRNKTIEDARKSLLGKTGVDKGFSSCAVVKGRGFSKKDIVYNIYCPRGTKMLYLEPFSSFGRGTQSPYWDGKTKQSDFGYEVEMLLQRNTTFRITKIEKSDKWYIDVEVIGQL